MPASADRRYLIWMAAALFAMGGAVILLNRAANPYCLFATDWIPSDSKPETFAHLRMVKAAQVRHLRPQSLILGSSRAETGLDPGHPLWQARPVYNLGLSNAGIYEIQRYFQHAAALAPVKQAVLLLDFSAFLSGNDIAPDFREERLAVAEAQRPAGGIWWQDFAVSLASWDAFMGTVATLSGRPGEKSYLADGSRDGAVEDARVLSKGGTIKAFAAYEARILQAGPPLAPSLAGEKLECLRQILRLARRNSIDLRLAIAPMHARYLEILDLHGQWRLYEDWKAAVVRVVEEEAGDSGQAAFILADFSGYNDFTSESVPARGLAEYYYEASHFTKKLGDELLRRLLGAPEALAEARPGTFGVLLKSSRLSQQLEAIRADREAYRARHQRELEELRRQSLAASRPAPENT